MIYRLKNPQHNILLTVEIIEKIYNLYLYLQFCNKILEIVFLE
jgi:hypothetical protein